MKYDFTFHIDGFHFYLNIVRDNIYIDQHGMNWRKIGTSFESENGGLVYKTKTLPALSNKDFFLFQREAYHYRRVNRF